MPLSWMPRPRLDDVDTLVARGKYAKAARALRTAFQDRQPTLAERLRYADLLVLAEQGQEAIPVLIGVADEQDRYGFTDKAIEALRRAQAIDPAHPGIRERIKALERSPSREPDAPSAGAEDPGAALDDALGSTAPEAGDTAAAPAPASPGRGPAAAAEAAAPHDDLLIPEEDLEPEGEDRVAPLDAAESEPGWDEDALELIEVSDGPAGTQELWPLLTESDLEGDDHESAERELEIGRLHAFLAALGRIRRADGTAGLGVALFTGLRRGHVPRIAGGVRRRRYAPGDVLVTEGDPGHSVFLIARGSVRILVRDGHGQPFDVRRLDAGDSFGEVAVLSGSPRTATVVAATPCDVLEVDREALGTLLRLRPGARRQLEQMARARRDSAEEKAVRSLPAAAADPERAAEALRAHFGGSEWSFPVRLHLAQLMVDVGRQEEALAILASVAEDLARAGHAQKAIAVLKKVEWIRRRGGADIQVAPPKKGRRRSARPRPAAPAGSRPLLPPDASAATHAAFREWVGSMLRQTHALAARSTSPRDVPQEAGSTEEEDSFTRQSA